MNRIKSVAILLVAAALYAVVVHAESNKQIRPEKVKPKSVPLQQKEAPEPKEMMPAAPQTQVQPVSIPQTTPLTRSRQGYLMVTDVLDGFAGESESDNYRIPVNSGGQPSAIGLSDSDNWGTEAGYVMGTRVVRGDLNADRIINVGDVVYMVNYLYRAGGEPCPIESGDVTADGIVNVGDVVFLVNYLYRGGDPPPC